MKKRTSKIDNYFLPLLWCIRVLADMIKKCNTLKKRFVYIIAGVLHTSNTNTELILSKEKTITN